MNDRALLLAVASCFALTGCPDKDEPPKPKAAVAPVAAAPKPPEAPAAPPASSGPDAKTQVAQGAAPAKAGGKKKKFCKKGGCDVMVSVSNCTITLDYDDLEVDEKNQDDKITWGLVGKDYTFTDTGIGFKTANATGPKGQFYNNKNQGSMYVWWDRNTDKNKYDYWVEVQKVGGATCPRYDPSVVNGVPPANP